MKTNIKIVGIFLSAFLILLIIVFGFKSLGPKKAVFPSADLTKHPVYGKYKYEGSENHIYIGTQPLYSPTGLITEAMKRDNLLRKKLLELGMELHFHPFFKGNDANFFLKHGDLDAGIGGDMPAIRMAATSRIVITSLIQYGPTSIVAKKLMLLKNLRGKRIGYALGSNAHYMLLSALSSAGLNKEDVHLIPLEVSQMTEALKTGTIEAFAAWEPTPGITLIKYPYFAIHKKLSSGYIYFKKSFSDKYPEALRHILASKIRAIRWIKRDHKNLLLSSQWAIQTSERLTGEKFSLTIEQNAELAGKDILGRHSILTPEIPESDLVKGGPINKEFNFLSNLGLIPSSSNWNTVQASFDQRIVTEILTNSRKYNLSVFDYQVYRQGQSESRKPS